VATNGFRILDVLKGVFGSLANHCVVMEPNPYQSPREACDLPDDIVDRAQRSALRAAICRFLSEEATAFEFDESLDPFRDSPDSAVRYVAEAAWYHYDDCHDHLVALSKPEWDYFQRLLLLLDSGHQVKTVHTRHWSVTQLVALLALAGFLGAVWHSGFGYHLLLVVLPLGLVSIGISGLRTATADVGPYDAIIFPFASLADLRAAYESVAFRKCRYPRKLAARRIRSPFMATLNLLHVYAFWLVLSPLALAYQMLPWRETHTRVIAA
jgi:hypothetical protein